MMTMEVIHLPTPLDMTDCVPVKVEASALVEDELPVEFTAGTISSEVVVAVGKVEGDPV